MGFMLRWLLGLTLSMIVLTGLEGSAQSSPPASANPLLREEQKITVNGIAEIWRLEWKSAPEESLCGTGDPDVAMTCPCGGFAYGESGQLDLVRLANGKEINRLELTPLFERVLSNQNGAILQKWPVDEKDFSNVHLDGFSELVRMRPIVRVMNFADYNHDGNSTEFFLQTSVAPCSKILGVVIGVTPKNPKLHAFGSKTNPNEPLVLQKIEWDALRKNRGPIEVLDWPCGDHGSESQANMNLRTIDGVIQAIRREFECTEGGKRGRLISEQNR
jgi:hypothetical protein